MDLRRQCHFEGEGLGGTPTFQKRVQRRDEGKRLVKHDVVMGFGDRNLSLIHI